MKVREDQIRLADGNLGVYGVVEKADYALIMPHQDGRVWLVEQYRYPVRARYWEFPQGSWEGDLGASPTDVARGELKEETGMTAGTLREIGTFFQAYGYSNQVCHVFLAEDLDVGEQELTVEEEGLVTHSFAVTEFEDMIRSGTIQDVSTLAAFQIGCLTDSFRR